MLICVPRNQNQFLQSWGNLQVIWAPGIHQPSPNGYRGRAWTHVFPWCSWLTWQPSFPKPKWDVRFGHVDITHPNPLESHCEPPFHHISNPDRNTVVSNGRCRGKLRIIKELGPAVSSCDGQHYAGAERCHWIRCFSGPSKFAGLKLLTYSVENGRSSPPKRESSGWIAILYQSEIIQVPFWDSYTPTLAIIPVRSQWGR